jgi:hypothetical protein
MNQLSLETRIETFVGWIRPDPDTSDDTERQRSEVRSRIKDKAEKDGLA